MLKPARYVELGEGALRCRACLFQCFLMPGEKGKCGVRANIGGEIHLTTYGLLSEVKALSWSFLPVCSVKLRWLFVGVVGCNLRCMCCGCSEFAFDAPYPLHRCVHLYPEELVERAISSECQGLYFDCGEPFCSVEYLEDVAHMAKSRGLKVAVHTNATFSLQVIDRVAGLLDLMVVDIKAYSEAVFKSITGSYSARKVLEAVEYAYGKGVPLEIVTPVVFGVNDGVFEVRSIARWISQRLSPHVPWHLVPWLRDSKTLSLTASEKLISIMDVGVEEGLRRVIIHQGGILNG